MADPFSKLFDDYPLMQGDVKPVVASAVSQTAPSSNNSLASAASLFALPSTPASKNPSKIRRLPREIIKKGTYGPEYEKWREEQDRLEEEERLRALAPPSVAAPSSEQNKGNSNVVVVKESAPRPKKPVSGNKIKIELVERGVPKKQWFLIKWMVEEGSSQENDAVVLFEEDLKQSNEVWNLPLAHRKPRGSTHCHRDSKIGRFFAAYLRPDGTVLCRSPTVLIGPKVQIKAEVKANLVHVRYRIESEQKSSWDWIGIYHSTQEEQYTDYVGWSYIDPNAEAVSLEAPVTPGDYVCCYFSSAKKYCPMAFSNFINFPDANELSLQSLEILPGSKICVSINIKSHLRDDNDWIGLYRTHQHKKHLYLAYQSVKKDVQSLEFPIVPDFKEDSSGGFVLRFVSISAAPLSSGAVITSSAPFQIKIK